MSDEPDGSGPDRDDSERGVDRAAGHPEPTTVERAVTRLEQLRTTPRERRVATAVALAVGLFAATVDPLGIGLGAALVALPARDSLRGIGAAVGFGAVVVAVFLVDLALAGALGQAVGTGAPLWLAIGIAVGGSVLGGLVRVVV